MERLTVAGEYICSTEGVNSPGNPRALMMSAQLPVERDPAPRGLLGSRWTVDFGKADCQGRYSTLEYRIPYGPSNTILRLVHRYDDSRGPGGGFFRGADAMPGVASLTPTQHLLIFALIFTMDR